MTEHLLEQLKKIIGKLPGDAINLLQADKSKSAASVLGLPICFKYDILATGHASATPDIEATKEYLKHLREVWLDDSNKIEENKNDKIQR